MLSSEADARYFNGGSTFPGSGKPGKRPYHPRYYACFVLDPDGNNVEAVYHGPANRSAQSVKVTFNSTQPASDQGPIALPQGACR